MLRSASVVMVMYSLTAWATGERLRLSPAAEPLRELLCVSMTCLSAGPVDAVVVARQNRGQLELTLERNGASRLVHTAPLRDGRLSSLDAVTAATALVQAIEGHAVASAPSPAAPQKPSKRLAKAKRGAVRFLAAR